MADFGSIPINGTSAKLQELLDKDIVDVVSEESTDEQLPTAKAVNALFAKNSGTINSLDSDLNANRHNITNISNATFSKKRDIEGEEVYSAFTISCGSASNGDAFVNFSDSESEEPVRITGVADGTHDNEAATCGQLWGMADEKENIANRVNVINELSDDEHYPSALAVLNLVKNQSGSSSGGLLGYIDIDPTKQLSAQYLTIAYKADFYTTFSHAVADINSNTIGTNADATENNALCAIYTDCSGNVFLILLADIDLSETITITKTVNIKVNGYTINYLGDYAIAIEGNNSIFDLRVKGSQLVKNVDVIKAAAGLVLFRAKDCIMIGGSVFYTATSIVSAVSYALTASGSAFIKNVNIFAEITNGDKQLFGFGIQGFLEAENASFSIKNKSGQASSVVCLPNSGGCILKNCKLASETDSGPAYGVQVSTTKETVVDSCEITVASPGGNATGVYVSSGCYAKAINSKIFADGIHGGDTTGDLPGQSIGIQNKGLLAIENCNFFGTHSGIQCDPGSTTTINGGLYEGVGHGGIYLYNADGNFYAQNASFKCVPYRGSYKDRYIYQNIDYINAAAYVGNVSGISGYFDNCIFDGTGPCVQPADSNGYPTGGEPVRFKSGGAGNSIYASNCTFMGDGKIRFGNSGQRLYLGWANRILCESSIPECLDTTTYAGKVFTSYEEE